MSIASYKQNVAKRVAGPHLPVCFPAALEQISPHHRYRPQAYQGYHEFIKWFSAVPKLKRRRLHVEYADMLDTLVRPLGGLSWQDLHYSRATTPLGLTRVAQRLIRDNCRVTVDIKIGRGTHAVGLLPTPEEGYVTLVSTHVPKCLQGIVSLSQVGNHLYIDDDPHHPAYPFSDANVIALPDVA